MAATTKLDAKFAAEAKHFVNETNWTLVEEEEEEEEAEEVSRTKMTIAMEVAIRVRLKAIFQTGERSM